LVIDLRIGGGWLDRHKAGWPSHSDIIRTWRGPRIFVIARLAAKDKALKTGALGLFLIVFLSCW